jgi:hypothetical protein
MDRLRHMGTAVCLLLVGPTVTTCDTLYKQTNAIAIGKGTAEGRAIHWTDCSGGNAKEYVKPPYWMEKADNCKLNPRSFGLEERADGRFVIADEKTFGKFFADPKAGEIVGFAKTSDSVQLTYRSKTLKLKTEGTAEFKP